MYVLFLKLNIKYNTFGLRPFNSISSIRNIFGLISVNCTLRHWNVCRILWFYWCKLFWRNFHITPRLPINFFIPKFTEHALLLHVLGLSYGGSLSFEICSDTSSLYPPQFYYCFRVFLCIFWFRVFYIHYVCVLANVCLFNIIVCAAHIA